MSSAGRACKPRRAHHPPNNLTCILCTVSIAMNSPRLLPCTPAPLQTREYFASDPEQCAEAVAQLEAQRSVLRVSYLGGQAGQQHLALKAPSCPICLESRADAPPSQPPPCLLDPPCSLPPLLSLPRRSRARTSQTLSSATASPSSSWTTRSRRLSRSGARTEVGCSQGWVRAG